MRLLLLRTQIHGRGDKRLCASNNALFVNRWRQCHWSSNIEFADTSLNFERILFFSRTFPFLKFMEYKGKTLATHNNEHALSQVLWQQTTLHIHILNYFIAVNFHPNFTQLTRQIVSAKVINLQVYKTIIKKIVTGLLHQVER